MKGANSPKIKRIVSENPIIPKCSSVESFFSLKKLKTKNPMICSTEGIFKSLNGLSVSTYMNPESKCKGMNSLPTMETSVDEDSLEFRKRHPQTRCNKIPIKKKSDSQPKFTMKLLQRHFMGTT